MENNNYNFDLDSILAEFVEEKKNENRVENRSFQPEASQPAVRSEEQTEKSEKEEKKPSRKAYSKDDLDKIFDSCVPDKGDSKRRSSPKASEESHDNNVSYDDVKSQDIQDVYEQQTAVKPAKKKKKNLESKMEKEDGEIPSKPPILNIVFAVAFGICLVWGLFNLNPYKASSAAKPIATPIPTVKAEPTQTPVETEETETQDEETTEETEAVVEKAKYVLEEGQMAPAANPACFGSVSVENASEITAVYDKARELGLLREDEPVYFDPSIEFNTGSYYKDIQYYLDETILVVCWKEIEDGSTLTMCEIKIADGSQFRMEVFGDINNENDNSYLSQMVLANNAVVAMNSDKCKARGDGVLVCNRTLYKYNENTYAGSLKRYNCLDNCYVTGDGDFLFTRRLQEMTTEEIQQYIADNNIIFSISFGPLLIENGEMVYGYDSSDDDYIEYAFGETEKPYSRCGMGQIDERHYLYTSLNHSDEAQARWTMREFAQHMYDRNILKNFYALDGGQTAEIILNDPSSIPTNANDWAYNHIDFGAERYTSNCIYFATAIPN